MLYTTSGLQLLCRFNFDWQIKVKEAHVEYCNKGHMIQQHLAILTLKESLLENPKVHIFKKSSDFQEHFIFM